MSNDKISINGKGSKPRPYKYSSYAKGYDEIEWRKKGTYCYNCSVNFTDGEKRKYDEEGNACCIGECNFN